MEIVIIACIIYISLNIYICNTCIKINKIEIKNSKIPKEFDGFKIAQLSDLHSEYKGKENINILKSIEKINPDIIVTTGDMIDKNDKNFDSYISLLNKLNKKYNIYSVGGNNEIALPYEKYKEYKSKSIKAHGLIIDNKKIELQKGKSKINIYGIRYKHNLTAKNKKEKNEYILEKSIGEVIEKEYNIVLAHNPLNLEPLADAKLDLVISGHVHGGIIKIFGRGLFSPERKFFPKYTSGIYLSKNGKTNLVVNSGLSRSPLYFRINNRIEITQIILKNEE